MTIKPHASGVPVDHAGRYRRMVTCITAAYHTISVAEKRVVSVWQNLVVQQEAALIGMVRQKVLSGIRETAAFNQLQLRLSDMPYLATGIGEHDLAAEFFNVCRAQGIAGSSVDMLICAASVQAEVPILTVDKDFKRYAAVLPIKLAKVG
jgi:predicted nucleic acid-binding protein